jgi:ATP-dependent DNA ligase
MAFPIAPPVAPMLAKQTPSIPTGDGWIYEPKWDGFRALVFRDGPTVKIQSRDLKPLNRYFPELEAPLLELAGPDARFVVDGEDVGEQARPRYHRFDSFEDAPARGQRRAHGHDAAVVRRDRARGMLLVLFLDAQRLQLVAQRAGGIWSALAAAV